MLILARIFLSETKVLKKEERFYTKKQQEKCNGHVSQPSHMCDISGNYVEQTVFRWQNVINSEILIVNIHIIEYLCFRAVCVWAIWRILYKSKPKSGLFLCISKIVPAAYLNTVRSKQKGVALISL